MCINKVSGNITEKFLAHHIVSYSELKISYKVCGFIITCTKSNVNIQLSQIKARG